MRARTIRPGFSMEYAMWIFTRLSGVGMILLALIGISGALLIGARTQMDLATLMRWTFFPNPNHVVNSEIPDVAWDGRRFLAGDADVDCRFLGSPMASMGCEWW